MSVSSSALPSQTDNTSATHNYYQKAIDEMFTQWGNFNQTTAHYQQFAEWLRHQKPSFLQEKKQLAEKMFKEIGITFNVYQENILERTIPFDILPRIISHTEWLYLERGLKQRIYALNLFLHDIYHDQKILKAGIIPAQAIIQNAQYCPQMMHLNLPKQIYTHIAGIDLVRDEHGQFCVLEDNLRVPSGVSYMLENRRMMMRLFPQLFNQQTVLPVNQYIHLLKQTLCHVAPKYSNQPTIVVLTPGIFNSAYFEHAFLAQQLGVELVEGKDLVIKDLMVYMRTTQGLKKIDVIYRRVDDSFLDPLCFNHNSQLGVAGLMAAYRAGHVNLVNAVGTGVADDKAIYSYVPSIIKFYLNEEPILQNVTTYRCSDAKQKAYVLQNIHQLVIKEVHGSGGYGMLIGPQASLADIAKFKTLIENNPEHYIAQPLLCLSTCPTLVEQGIAPRHIDLRPFILSGETIQVVPGGLTRVALKEGSLVVNSSQGGGTKDTWVLQT